MEIEEEKTGHLSYASGRSQPAHGGQAATQGEGDLRERVEKNSVPKGTCRLWPTSERRDEKLDKSGLLSGL